MIDVIEYIRSFFKPSQYKSKRKRSAIDLPEEVVSPNKKRILSNSPEDNWVIPSCQFYSRGTQMDKKFTKPTIVVPTIVLDDGPEHKNNGAKPKGLNSSTPNTNTLHHTRLTNNGLQTRTDRNFSGMSNSIYFTPHLGAKDLFTKKGDTQLLQGTSDISFRLEEKRKYQELLNKTVNNDYSPLSESFSEYFTPISKTPLNRGRRMVDFLKSPPVAVVDLTNGRDLRCGKREAKNKTSTSETIQKVLDDMDDLVVVKDFDSDVEYLPTPPSPKPDFKIERVNSLKKLASSCEPLKENWIGDKVRKHREELAIFTSELATRQDQLVELRQINVDILREQLKEQVKKSLHIKEIVIPVEVKQALPELSSKQEEMVVFALDKRAPLGVGLVSKFNLNITRRDILTLAGLNWLNDEVINFYMNLIIERGKLDAFPNSYAFNTFFYPKILKDGQQSVRRWTRKVDVFAYDIICVPIHLGMHWCMVIINMSDKTIVYYDSMGKPNHACTKAVFKYLQDEYSDKKQCTFDTKHWQLICAKDIPQQMNGSDCGMFACTYAEFATRCAPFNFTQENMPYLRRKMVVEILSGHLLIQSR